MKGTTTQFNLKYTYLKYLELTFGKPSLQFSLEKVRFYFPLILLTPAVPHIFIQLGSLEANM